MNVALLTHLQTPFAACGAPKAITRPPVPQWLAEQAARLGPGGFIIEVGTWCGATAVQMAFHGPLVLCIDTFAADTMTDNHTGNIRGTVSEWAKTIGLSSLNRRIVGLQADSLRAASHCTLECADLVFIDADHSEAACRADILAWMPIVKPGGILCGDDWNLQSVRNAVHSIFPHPTILGDYGWWVSREVDDATH